MMKYGENMKEYDGTCGKYEKISGKGEEILRNLYVENMKEYEEIFGKFEAIPLL